MTLDEILRSHCRDVAQALDRSGQLAEEARRNRVAALDRVRRAREEADRLRAARDERSKSSQILQSKIADLEDQLAGLQARIKGLQRELRESTDAAAISERQVAEQRKLERTDAELADRLAREIEAAETSLERERARLRDARRAALAEYLHRLWGRLREVFESHESRREAVEARRRLEEQRHQDAELASLWEAREEWRRILASSGPTLVIKTARAELDRIEAQLKSRFPGALDVTLSAQAPSEIEELFVASRRGHLSAWVPLPIPLEVWRNLEAGGRGAAETIAMRLVWALARSVPQSAHDGAFFATDLYCGFATACPEQELTRIATVVLELPTGGSVSFLLSPLPAEVADVVSQESDE
jgi:hypothetical protein